MEQATQTGHGAPKKRTRRALQKALHLDHAVDLAAQHTPAAVEEDGQPLNEVDKDLVLSAVAVAAERDGLVGGGGGQAALCRAAPWHDAVRLRDGDGLFVHVRLERLGRRVLAVA